MKWVASTPPPPQFHKRGSKILLSIFLGILLPNNAIDIWYIQVQCKSHPTMQKSGGADNSVFDSSRYSPPKLAFVPRSRLNCDKDVCYMNVWGKSL